MKVSNIRKLDNKLEQHDISTQTENFYVRVGDVSCLIHNSPAVVFGRNEQGEFVLTDKSGFVAKGYDGKSTSADALRAMLSNRKADMTPERQTFVDKMANIFNEYKYATPPGFRGYLSGDLMYFNTPPLKNDMYSFKPNIVQYDVTANSEIGKRIGSSKTGIVVHNYYGDQFSSVQDALKNIKSNDVFIIPPVYVAHPSQINTAPIDKVEAFARKNAGAIQELFNPAGLKGIANIHALFYKYINNKVDSGLENLGADFTEWLNTEPLTDKKRANIVAYLQKNAKGVAALWAVIGSIMKLKDYLVAEFDSHPSDVSQSINGQSGGEGYVVKHPDGAVKLVQRSTFTKANRAAH
jgi:hypothetical protein